jgi:cytochrome oxidase Cu insertion factor (SCO1/SenC/PrrC family)
MNDAPLTESDQSRQQLYDAPTPGSSLPYFLAIAVLFLMVYGGYSWWQVQQWELRRGEAIPIAAIGPPLTEFELTERSGEPFRSADMRGKVWVVTYFFTTCPGSCIRLNQNIKFMHNMPELKDVTWVSITCDPDNDSVKALRDYADRWQADPRRWLFCRADLDYTKRVAKGMNLALERKGHQDYAIVIDKTGKMCAWYDATSKSECQRLHTRLLECLAESPSDDLAATPAQKTSS